MAKVKQYQEHHYCDTDNCNKEVMLGDEASTSEIEYLSLFMFLGIFST